MGWDAGSGGLQPGQPSSQLLLGLQGLFLSCVSSELPDPGSWTGASSATMVVGQGPGCHPS